MEIKNVEELYVALSNNFPDTSMLYLWSICNGDFDVAIKKLTKFIENKEKEVSLLKEILKNCKKEDKE